MTFGHGVASFDPTPSGVLLWARAEGAATLRWKVVLDPGAAAVAREGEAPVDPDTGIAVVDVEGLEPATTYHYWFEAGPVEHPVLSPVGRTRTLPEGPTDRVRLGVVCCDDYANGPFTALRALAEQEVDLVLHLGDYIYDTPDEGVRTPLPRHDLVGIDDYRARYAQVRADPDLLALHLRHPMVAIWDDHDVADNAWRHGAKAHDPDEHGPWEVRLAAAARARQEWVPARLRDPDDPLVLWRSVPLGDLAELVVLDTRIAGRDMQAGDPGAKSVDDPGRSILGDEQRRWAYERIADTSRPWCLLASQVAVSPMTLGLPSGATLADRAPSGYAVIDGEAMCTDEWDGYPAERDRLARQLRARGGGTVIVSGDVHSAWLFAGPTDELGPVAAEVVAPAVSSTPMGEQLPRGTQQVADLLAESDEAVWADLLHQGHLVLDVTRGSVRADWFWIDPAEPEAAPRHGAAFRIGRDLPPTIERLTDDVGEDPPPPPVPELEDRPGLPTAALPPPDRAVSDALRRREARSRAWAAVMAGGVLVGAALGARLLRRRRG
jgi:alkaline phosphatase D